MIPIILSFAYIVLDVTQALFFNQSLNFSACAVAVASSRPNN